MEVLLISNDLLGPSGRPVWSKSVCTWLPVSQGWFEDVVFCCKRVIGIGEMPTCFGDRARRCLMQLPGTIFRSNEKNQVWGKQLNHGLARDFCAIPIELFVQGRSVGFFKEQRASPSDANTGESVTVSLLSRCYTTYFCDSMLQTTQKWHYFYVCLQR